MRGSGDNEQFLVVALQQLHYLFAGVAAVGFLAVYSDIGAYGCIFTFY